MTNEEISFRTKKQLAAALKKEMKKKPLSAVTVSSLIKICNINRNTFYYHFENIYDLLRWLLEEEAVEVMRKTDLLVNPAEALNFILDYVDSNKYILNCACDALSYKQIQQFFYTEMTSVIEGTIEEAEFSMQVSLEKSYRDFVVNFFTEALSGSLLSYISGQRKLPREVITENLISLCTLSLENMLRVKGRPVDNNV